MEKLIPFLDLKKKHSKMKKNMIMVVLYAMLCWSCFKEKDFPKCCEAVETPTVSQRSPVEVIWKKPILSDTSTHYVNPAVPVMFSDRVFFPLREKIPNRMYDKNTGAVLWEWLDEQDSEFTMDDNCYNYQDKYLLNVTTFKKGINVFDMDGNEVWRERLQRSKRAYSENDFNVVGDNVYSIHTDAYKWSEAMHLIRFKIGEWKIDTLFTMHKQGDYHPSLTPPAVWQNELGDEVLIFQNRKWGGNVKERVEYIAYNATRQELLWKKDSLQERPRQQYLFSTKSIPKVKGDYVFILGGFSVLCFHIPTGNLIWETEVKGLGEAFFTSTSSLHLIDDEVCVMTINGILYVLNEKTGAVAWNSTWEWCRYYGSTYHNGILYVACSELVAIDIKQRKLLWSIRSPSPGQNLIQGITVDPKTGYLYIIDSRSVMCLKVK
jgi:outer membrane protein assembly factor BamB